MAEDHAPQQEGLGLEGEVLGVLDGPLLPLLLLFELAAGRLCSGTCSNNVESGLFGLGRDLC